MAKKKRPTDISLLARQIVEEAIGEPLTETPAQEPTTVQPTREKNAAAVALGRLGGLTPKYSSQQDFPYRSSKNVHFLSLAETHG